jgi:hypothetical protein
METVTALIVRSFETPSGLQRYTRVLELPCVPAADHRLTVPGAARPLPVARVVLHARPASDWPFGVLPVTVEVELGAEDVDGLEAAVARGWKAVESAPSRPVEAPKR